MGFPLKRSNANISYGSALDMPRSKRVRRSRSVKDDIRSRQSVLSRKVAALSRMVELKYVSGSITNTGISNAGNFSELSVVAQGDTISTRTAIKVTPTVVTLRYQLESETADAVNTFRIIVIQAKQGVPTALNMPTPYQGFHPQDLARYNVLYDELKTVESDWVWNGAGLTGVTKYQSFVATIPILNQIWYNEGANTAVKGGVYLWITSDSAAAPHPDMENLGYELYFKDA